MPDRYSVGVPSTVVEAIESITFMVSAWLTWLQRLLESPEMIGQICGFAGENVHSFLYGVEPEVAVSWKRNGPNPMSQTPQEVRFPIPVPLRQEHFRQCSAWKHSFI